MVEAQSKLGSGPIFARQPGKQGGAASVLVKVQGVKRLDTAFRALGETAAPYLDAALEQSGEDLAAAIRRHAPGSMRNNVDVLRLSGSTPAYRKVRVAVGHPGAKPMEFGRKFYWTGYVGRKPKTGRKTLHLPGQRPKPFVGVVKNDGALGEVSDDIQKRLAGAVEAEFARLASDFSIDLEADE